MALQDRFEPWHSLVVLAFLVGAAGSLFGSGAEGFALVNIFTAVLSGLLWAFAVYIFVATFRNYVESYAESGGSLWDPRFLAPFVVGGIAGGVVYVTRPIEGKPTPTLLAEALSAGFWAFVLSMIAMLIASYVIAGYREAQP